VFHTRYSQSAVDMPASGTFPMLVFRDRPIATRYPMWTTALGLIALCILFGFLDVILGIASWSFDEIATRLGAYEDE
jgi:hypothetical protein